MFCYQPIILLVFGIVINLMVWQSMTILTYTNTINTIRLGYQNFPRKIKPTWTCITRKMVPITGRARSFLLVFKIKIERRGRQNKNSRPINFPNVITFSTDFKFTIHNKYIIYIHTYIYILFWSTFINDIFLLK